MNACRTGSGISLSGNTVRRSAPSSLMRRPSAAYTFDVWTWWLGFATSREMLGQCSPAHTRRSEEHTSELQSRLHLVCRLLLEKKKKKKSPIDSRRTRDT